MAVMGIFRCLLVGVISMKRFSMKVPDGDNVARLVCGDCGFINYVNPKVVAGAVVTYGDRILLCKRDIEPRAGYWTLPAGYLEQGESPDAGARREAEEEACADIEIRDLLGVYSILHISQVMMIYRARLKDGKFAAGHETSDARLFAWDEIPWRDLAFESVPWALERFHEVRDVEVYTPFLHPRLPDLGL